MPTQTSPPFSARIATDALAWDTQTQQLVPLSQASKGQAVSLSQLDSLLGGKTGELVSEQAKNLKVQNPYHDISSGRAQRIVENALSKIPANDPVLKAALNDPELTIYVVPGKTVNAYSRDHNRNQTTPAKVSVHGFSDTRNGKPIIYIPADAAPDEIAKTLRHELHHAGIKKVYNSPYHTPFQMGKQEAPKHDGTTRVIRGGDGSSRNNLLFHTIGDAMESLQEEAIRTGDNRPAAKIFAEKLNMGTYSKSHFYAEALVRIGDLQAEGKWTPELEKHFGGLRRFNNEIIQEDAHAYNSNPKAYKKGDLAHPEISPERKGEIRQRPTETPEPQKLPPTEQEHTRKPAPAAPETPEPKAPSPREKAQARQRELHREWFDEDGKPRHFPDEQKPHVSAPSKIGTATNTGLGVYNTVSGAMTAKDRFAHGDVAGGTLATGQAVTGTVSTTLDVLQATGRAAAAPVVRNTLGKANVVLAVADGVYQVAQEKGALNKTERGLGVVVTAGAATAATALGAPVLVGAAATYAVASTVNNTIEIRRTVSETMEINKEIEKQHAKLSEATKNMVNVKMISSRYYENLKKNGTKFDEDLKLDLSDDKSRNLLKMEMAAEKAELKKTVELNEPGWKVWRNFNGAADRASEAKTNLTSYVAAEKEMAIYEGQLAQTRQAEAQAPTQPTPPPVQAAPLATAHAVSPPPDQPPAPVATTAAILPAATTVALLPAEPTENAKPTEQTTPAPIVPPAEDKTPIVAAAAPPESGEGKNKKPALAENQFGLAGLLIGLLVGLLTGNFMLGLALMMGGGLAGAMADGKDGALGLGGNSQEQPYSKGSSLHISQIAKGETRTVVMGGKTKDSQGVRQKDGDAKVRLDVENKDGVLHAVAAQYVKNGRAGEKISMSPVQLKQDGKGNFELGYGAYPALNQAMDLAQEKHTASDPQKQAAAQKAALGANLSADAKGKPQEAGAGSFVPPPVQTAAAKQEQSTTR